CGERLGIGSDDSLSLALPAACAVELVHTYSLIHDDLPAMDNDTLRRGRPTNHVVFGEGMAILAGDALLTESFALLARRAAGARPTGARRRVGVLSGVAEAAGAAGMVGGQALDLQAATPGAAPLDRDALQAMHVRKTGALIRASAVAGAVIVGSDDQTIAA